MRRNRSGWPWTRPLLLLLLVAELVAASFALRTEHFLAEPVADALGRLGTRAGGYFTWTRVAPEGLTGVRVEGLAFYSRGRATPAAWVDEVRVYPHIPSLLRGRLAIERVSMGHAQLFLEERLVEQVRSSGPRLAGETAHAPRGLAATLRQLGIERLDVHVTDARLPDGAVALQLADFDARRDDAGLVIGAAVHALDQLLGDLVVEWPANGSPALRIQAQPDFPWERWLEPFGCPAGARVRLGAIELDAEPGEGYIARLEAVSLDGLAVLPLLGEAQPELGWDLEGAELARAEVRLAADGVAALLAEDVSLRIAGSQGHTARIALPSVRIGRTAGELPDLEVELGDGQGSAVVRLAAKAPGAPPVLSIDAHGYDLAPWAPLFSDELPLRLTAGRFSGHVDISWLASDETLRAELDGALSDGRALAPFLAMRPLEEIAVGLRGDLTLVPAEQTLTWEHGRLTLAGTPIAFTTRLDWSGELPHFELDAELWDVPAELLHHGLPRGLAPRLEGVDLGGTLSANIRVRLDGATPEASVLEVELDLGHLEIASLGRELPVASLDGDFRLDITGDDGVVRTIGPGLPGWVSLREVTPWLPQALVSAEDGSFWSHDGFDWLAVQRSVELNVREGRIVRGGSTISQQVVRTLFLGHERTLGRKLEEAFLTWQLEEHVGKERILELYLNAVHWGPGIQGVGEAARTYFRRTPDQLTLSEAAFLASILPNPDYFGLQYARNLVTPSRREKICNILRNMYNTAQIDERQMRRECEAVEAGVVSIVPPPSWLVDFEPAASPATPVHEARTQAESPTFTARLD